LAGARADIPASSPPSTDGRKRARGKSNDNGGKKNGNGANLGFEEKLWEAADKLRGHMDAAEYKHVVLAPDARWSKLKDNARQPTIGKLVDEAMEAIEKVNPSLKGVLSKDYETGRPDKTGRRPQIGARARM
jgi:type I restriction enzyme M protein